MDVIELRALRADGRHGVHATEREKPQPFEIDLRLEIDLAAAGASDALGDTVDYAALAQRVTAIVSTQSFALIERLGEEILRAVFSDPRIAHAEITIAKPQALPNATPVIRLRRANPRYV